MRTDLLTPLRERIRGAVDFANLFLTPPPVVLPEHMPEIRVAASTTLNNVEAYWHRHTVNSTPFRSTAESERHLEWRFEQYPLFREFQQLWGEHTGEVVLDYGCGPGEDLIGLLLYSGARHVVGIDVSPRALELARFRVGLHRVDLSRVSLILADDDRPTIPLPTEWVDFVNCQGVLHHTSYPEAIMREFRRVLRPGGRLNLMIYNRDSIWFHLYTAYAKMVVEEAFPGLSVDEAFSRNTDGEECPISRAYSPDDVTTMARAAGFDGEFVGGYLSRTELACAEQHLKAALDDPRLGAEHRAFLSELTLDDGHLPLYRGFHAGIGGSFRLRTT